MWKLVVTSTLIVTLITLVCGKDIKITQVPHQASIQRYGSHICSGSLIAEDLVLTAAHCEFSEDDKDNIKVRVGSTLWNNHSAGQLIDVKHIINHLEFSEAWLFHDLALLRLSRNVTLSKSVEVIRLATKVAATGDSAFTSGWGKTNEMEKRIPEQLNGLNVTVIAAEDCKSKWSYTTDEIDERDICAIVRGKNRCKGDDGGPLVIDGELSGVVSHGEGCTTKNPLQCASVYSHLVWIKDNTKNIRSEDYFKEEDDGY